MNELEPMDTSSSPGSPVAEMVVPVDNTAASLLLETAEKPSGEAVVSSIGGGAPVAAQDVALLPEAGKQPSGDVLASGIGGGVPSLSPQSTETEIERTKYPNIVDPVTGKVIRRTYKEEEEAIHRSGSVLSEVNTNDLAMLGTPVPSSFSTPQTSRVSTPEPTEEPWDVSEAQLLCLIKRHPDANIVLIGDPLQMRPHRYEDTVEMNLAGRSALDVAGARGGFSIIQLDRVYRAYPSLTSLYSRSFYSGTLVPVREELNPAQKNLLEAARILPDRGDPYAIVNISQTAVARNASRSIKNVEEAKLALMAIQRLLRAGVLPGDILVICLYAFQQSAFRCLLAGTGLAIDVLTVDSAQGRERRVVLLLTSRVKGGKSNFFEDPRRVNVAISRQQDALLIFGNPTLLKPLDAWHRLMEIAAQAKAIIKIQGAEPSEQGEPSH